jgi:hypothetical protein
MPMTPPDEDATGQGATPAGSVGREARAAAADTMRSAAGEARHRAEAAREEAAEEVSTVAAALRHASGELRDGSPQERLFGAMADSLADFADTVRGKDIGGMAGDLGEFARRNPAAFLGGAALAGFAAARMARASQRAGGRTPPDDGHGRPGRGAAGGTPPPGTTRDTPPTQPAQPGDLP